MSSDDVPLAAMKALYSSKVRIGFGSSTKKSLSTPATVCALVSRSRLALRPARRRVRHAHDRNT